jgi:hypothetical protein
MPAPWLPWWPHRAEMSARAAGPPWWSVHEVFGHSQEECQATHSLGGEITANVHGIERIPLHAHAQHEQAYVHGSPVRRARVMSMRVLLAGAVAGAPPSPTAHPPTIIPRHQPHHSAPPIAIISEVMSALLTKQSLMRIVEQASIGDEPLICELTLRPEFSIIQSE